MKRSIVGAVAATVMAVAPAFANEAAQAVNPFQWSGLYFGAQAGAGKVDGQEGYEPDWPILEQTIGAEGWVGGLFLGYNHFLTENLLAGAEVEGNLSQLTGESGNSLNGPYYVHDWSAAARLRFGILPAPNVLLYGSVGAALGHFDYSQGTLQRVYKLKNLDQTLAGLQLGFGAEAFVNPKLSIRGEAIYTRYAEAIFNASSGPAERRVRLDTLMVRAAIAYHPGWLGQPQAPVPAEMPMVSWDGLYAGGQVGLTFGDTMEDDATGTVTGWHIDYAAQGTSVGGHVGASRQFGMWVAGLEADGTWHGDSGFSFRTVYGEQAWSAGLRARLGLLAMRNVLFYGTVGWTVGSFDYSDTYPAVVGLIGTTFTGQGLQFGGGIEAFLTPHVSARVEALYSDYGSHAIHYTGAPFVTVTPHTLEARFGLSWHLN